MECIFLEGGAPWCDLVTPALDTLNLDPRARREILEAGSYTTRLWFVIVMMYALQIEIAPVDPYTLYLVTHGYDYIYNTIYVIGDVYYNMYILHQRACEYRDMVGAHREIEQRHSDL